MIRIDAGGLPPGRFGVKDAISAVRKVLVSQQYANQGFVDMHPAVVLDVSLFPESVHEEADS